MREYRESRGGWAARYVPLFPAPRKQRQTFCDFEAILVHIESSRPVMITQWDPVSTTNTWERTSQVSVACWAHVKETENLRLSFPIRLCLFSAYGYQTQQQMLMTLICYAFASIPWRNSGVDEVWKKFGMRKHGGRGLSLVTENFAELSVHLGLIYPGKKKKKTFPSDSKFKMWQDQDSLCCNRSASFPASSFSPCLTVSAAKEPSMQAAQAILPHFRCTQACG